MKFIVAILMIAAGFFLVVLFSSKTVSFVASMAGSRIATIDPAGPCDGDDCMPSTYGHQTGPVPTDLRD